MLLEMAGTKFGTWCNGLPKQNFEEPCFPRELLHSTDFVQNIDVSDPKCAFSCILSGNCDSGSPFVWQFLTFLKSLNYVKTFENGVTSGVFPSDGKESAELFRNCLLRWCDDFFLCGLDRSESFLSSLEAMAAGTFPEQCGCTKNLGEKYCSFSAEAYCNKCPICMENERDFLLLPCRHTICKSCLLKLMFVNLNLGKAPNPLCPNCRGNVSKGISFYV